MYYLRDIDKLVETAKSFFNNNFTLQQLLREARNKFPELKEKSNDSLAATMNYHCVNMQSRFQKPNNPKASADWMKKPYFYRIGRGTYRLLTKEEQELVLEAIKRDISLVYQREWYIEDLKKLLKGESIKRDDIMKMPEIKSPSLKNKYQQKLENAKHVMDKPLPSRIRLYDKLADILIDVYNNRKIPNYLPIFTKAKVDKNAITKSPQGLFRLLIYAAYDRWPFTQWLGGWEVIWGIKDRNGINLPKVLEKEGLLFWENIYNWDISKIKEKLTSIKFLRFRLSDDGGKTFYHNTFKQSSVLSKRIFDEKILISAKDALDVRRIKKLFVKIHGIGETIASKLVMYTLRELKIGNVHPSAFKEVVAGIENEFHNLKLLKALSSLYNDPMIFRGIIDALNKKGDPFAIDALYYIDREEPALKNRLFNIKFDNF